MHFLARSKNWAFFWSSTAWHSQWLKWMILTVWLKGYRAQLLVFQILLSQNCCLLTTSLRCPMSMISCRPGSTGLEFMPTGNLWWWTHKNLKWCASTPGLATVCLLFIMTARNYPTPTHSNIWAWCVTKISIWPIRDTTPSWCVMWGFAPSSSEFIPFLTCHHSITDFEINAFLNQDPYRLLKFVSD